MDELGVFGEELMKTVNDIHPFFHGLQDEKPFFDRYVSVQGGLAVYVTIGNFCKLAQGIL
jgi:hypothetical protein